MLAGSAGSQVRAAPPATSGRLDVRDADDRTIRREGFEDRHAEALEQRRERQGQGVAVEVDQLAPGHEAEMVNALHRMARPQGVPTLGMAREDEAGGRPLGALAPEPMKGLEQGRMVLVAPDIGREEEIGLEGRDPVREGVRHRGAVRRGDRGCGRHQEDVVVGVAVAFADRAPGMVRIGRHRARPGDEPREMGAAQGESLGIEEIREEFMLQVGDEHDLPLGRKHEVVLVGERSVQDVDGLRVEEVLLGRVIAVEGQGVVDDTRAGGGDEVLVEHRPEHVEPPVRAGCDQGPEGFRDLGCDTAGGSGRDVAQVDSDRQGRPGSGMWCRHRFSGLARRGACVETGGPAECGARPSP